jgi:SSS family solute:Na+ symporter
MMAFDVFRKYIDPKASDMQTVRFGQVFVVIMCVIAGFLAFSTYDPTSSDNFFLKLANQTSYVKPGLVVVFFWGVLWKKTNPIAALIVLLSSPFVGLGCDLVYNHLLVNVTWIRETFGEEFNFLYRVFLIFLIGSVLIYFFSLFFNKKNSQVHDQGLSVSFSGLREALLKFSVIQVPLIILCLTTVITPQFAAWPGAVLTLLLFFTYLKKDPEERPFYQSDIFYAGLLTACMVWIMFYFA